jgi:RNA-directed DNA polymerase
VKAGRFLVRGIMAMRGEDIGRSECRTVMVWIRVATSLGAKASKRPIGLLSQENLENRLYEGKQMTEGISGAPLACSSSWESINWAAIEQQVNRLQMRIAKAVKEGRHGRAKALQWLLTHSRNAKLLAVKRITQNRGRRTAGVDKIILATQKQKMLMVDSLDRRGYKAKPLRRIYIPKKKGLRPLGIPTMRDRAMQALYLLALEPISETTADRDSYGFRPKRSAADAIEQCFCCLRGGRSRAQWILEGDIKACFDTINHEWLLSNITTDKKVLKQWLSAGYVENQILLPTEEGTPQGGIISPVLANMTLDGLEETVYKAAYPRKSNKVSVVRYADDWLAIAESRELLESKIKPAIESFLKERGLELSQEKTKVTHVNQGADFLGFNIRRYSGKLLIKPAKSNVKRFLGQIRAVIKTNISSTTSELLGQLNPKIVGWAQYYKHVVSKRTFSMIDASIFHMLKWWINRRHPNKNWKWKYEKYFRRKGLRNWVFSTKTNTKDGKSFYFDLRRMMEIPIVRHVKVRREANPYDPAYLEYFEKRKKRIKPETQNTNWSASKTENFVGIR